MLSQTSEYALRACLHLAREGEDGPVRVDDIAKTLDVPRNYLSKILHELGRDGILESTRGPRGGFELALPPEEISLAMIVGHFDPEFLSDEGRCILGRMRCSDRDPCAVHTRWKGVAVRMRAFFRNTSLRSLSTPADEDAVASLAGLEEEEAGAG